MALALGALFFELDVGFCSFVIASCCCAADPEGHQGRGQRDRLADGAAGLRHRHLRQPAAEPRHVDSSASEVAGRSAPPLLAALLICYIGGVVSAFASTTGILGALIPLAVPFLDGRTSARRGRPDHRAGDLLLGRRLLPVLHLGALVVANAPEEQRDHVYRRLLPWGFSMVAIAPFVTWLLLVVPGWP